LTRVLRDICIDGVYPHSTNVIVGTVDINEVETTSEGLYPSASSHTARECQIYYYTVTQDSD